MLSVTQFEQEKLYPNYVPTKDEATKMGYVATRFSAMQSARSIVDKDWEIYQTMIDAVLVPYPDGRSSSNVPLASSLIELYIAEASKMATEFHFRGETSKFSTNAKALEHVWEYKFRKDKLKKVFIENEYTAAWFGTSVIFTGFESYEKTQQDPEVDDAMKLTWKKNTFKKEEIIVRNVDIRDFYIDDSAKNSIDDATDCILIQWIPYERFQNFKNSPVYKNIDKVAPRQYSTENHSFVNDEEMSKTGSFVKLTHYWNIEKDAYMVIANNNVIIREHPMVSTINWEKALPFVVRAFGKKNYSIYGRGLCEIALMFNSKLNNFSELTMDAIRRSNTQVLALGNGLSFNDRGFSYDNEILTFDWNLQNNFQQLSGNPPNQAMFSYIDIIYKEISIYVGIDIQNIMAEANTAFQAELQRGSSQKRINVWLLNRDLANERFADLYKDLLQTYFPRKTADGLYPQVEVEDEELVGSGEKQKFKKKKWKSMFQVTPELLRGDIFIDVHTNTTAPTINAVDRQQKLDLLNTVGQIAQGYMLAKQAGIDLENIIPIKSTLRDLASDYNIIVEDKTDNEDVQAKKAEVMQQFQAMMQSAPTEAQDWTPPEAQPQDPNMIPPQWNIV